jgi:hypothetical protein
MPSRRAVLTRPTVTESMPNSTRKTCKRICRRGNVVGSDWEACLLIRPSKCISTESHLLLDLLSKVALVGRCFHVHLQNRSQTRSDNFIIPVHGFGHGHPKLRWLELETRCAEQNSLNWTAAEACREMPLIKSRSTIRFSNDAAFV